jgi:RNA polymerase sigma-70 factor (ECF subfamily)
VDAAGRARLEEELAALSDARAWDRAITLLIQGYGPELLGLLTALHRDEQTASEVFAQLCESLWRGLPRFERRSTFRTWAFAAAHNASSTWLRDEAVRRRRHVGDSAVAELEARVRTQTLPYLRSQVRTRLEELRATLPREDQLLLILRVDKELEWSDLARVFHDGELDEGELGRESARLRKRFQLVKERLRSLAEAEGLLTRADEADVADGQRRRG